MFSKYGGKMKKIKLLFLNFDFLKNSETQRDAAEAFSKE